MIKKNDFSNFLVLKVKIIRIKGVSFFRQRSWFWTWRLLFGTWGSPCASWFSHSFNRYCAFCSPTQSYCRKRQYHCPNLEFQQVSVRFNWLSYDGTESFHSCTWCRVLLGLCWRYRVADWKSDLGGCRREKGSTIEEVCGWNVAYMFFSLQRRGWFGWWRLILIWGCATCMIGLGFRLPCWPCRSADGFFRPFIGFVRSTRRTSEYRIGSNLPAHRLSPRVTTLFCWEPTHFRQILC